MKKLNGKHNEHLIWKRARWKTKSEENAMKKNVSIFTVFSPLFSGKLGKIRGDQRKWGKDDDEGKKDFSERGNLTPQINPMCSKEKKGVEGTEEMCYSKMQRS